MALALLAGGAGVAIVSRRHADTTPPVATSRTPKSPKSLGPLPLALPDEPPQPARLSGKIEATENTDPPAMDPFATTSTAGQATPPRVPQAPGDDRWRPSARTASYQAAPFDNRGPRQVGATTPEAKSTRQSSVVLHRIADGDTLSGLAERYLGSSQRFAEIYDANRDRLQSPDLLPIGTMLRIPAGSPQR